MKNSYIHSRGIICAVIMSATLSACGGGGGGGSTQTSSKAAVSSAAPNPGPASSSSRKSSSSSVKSSSNPVVSSSSSTVISSSSVVSSSSLQSSINSSATVSSSSITIVSSSSLSSKSSSSFSSSLSSKSSSSSSSSSSSLAIVPAAPKNLTSTRQTGTGVSLSWTDVATNETAYVVKRATSDAPTAWVTLSSTLPANTTSYIDSSVVSVEAKGYIYQISAAIGQTLSDPLKSAEINLTGYQHPKAGSLAPVAASTWGTANWKLGGRFNGNDLEVGVYSKNAERILLEVYSYKHLADAKKAGKDEKAAQARQDYWLVKGADNIWRGKLANLPEGTLYAFRAWGPNWKWDEAWYRGHSAAGYISDVSRNGPADVASSYTGHRYNPNKVLIDPYALELSHDRENPELLDSKDNGGIYGTGGSDLAALVTDIPITATNPKFPYQYSGPITGNVAIDRRNIDTGIWAPKSVALKVTPYAAVKPNIPQESTIQMEAHLRGLTKHPSTGDLRSLLTNYKSWFTNFDDLQNIPEELRGTYKGAGMMAPYVKALGINVIEFLPMQESNNNENNDRSPTKANFWGYSTSGFFAPDRFYSSDKSVGGPTREFREMVEAFNKQGIEVWMDVVYNHTGEGGNWDSNFKSFIAGFNSFGGFDTTEYYLLNTDKRSFNKGATGVDNQLNFANQVNTNLVVDSLTYWADNMGISGFRFDLASVLGRTPTTFSSNSPAITAIRDLALVKNVKITAEPWDNWGSELGNFQSGWAEWNGRYRDATRKYLKGDTSGSDGVSLTDAFNGDWAHFNDNGGSQKTVNFIVAHDGLNLADMVSYNSDKTRNSTLAAPFGPTDGGTDNNESWDSTGTAKPADLTVEQFRRQRLRNFWVFQFFSRGVPMIVYGDEFGRTQNGNNNPYSIDTPATWNNYAMVATNAPQTVAVHPDYPTAKYHNNLGTATNTNATINPLLMFSREIMQRRKGDAALRQAGYKTPINYASETGAALDEGGARARRMHIEGSKAGGSDYVLFMNMWTAQLNFTFPSAPAGKKWVRIIDTANWAEKDTYNTWTDATAWPANAATYGVNPWSIVVFKAI